ncbi:MAG TPA: DUF6141 family protein [Thermomicrobiales bacterium]
MTNLGTNDVIFREEQRLRQWWILLIALALAVLGWAAFVEQIVRNRPFGNNPAPDWAVWLIWLALGIGAPAFFLLARMVVEVRLDRVTIRWIPITTREIRLADVTGVEVRTYRALREYGGWGIKGWSRRRTAYSVSGNRGVELELSDGRHVLIGSNRADELAAVVAGAIGRGIAGRRRPDD